MLLPALCRYVPLPVVPEPLSDQQAINALQTASQLGQALRPLRLPPPTPELEAQFPGLGNSVRSSELIHSLARLTIRWSRATQMTQTVSGANEALCPTGQPTQRPRVFASMYRDFPYAGEGSSPIWRSPAAGSSPGASTRRAGRGYREFPNRRSSIWTALLAPTNSLWPTYQQQLEAHSSGLARKVLGRCSPGRGNPAAKPPQNTTGAARKLYCLRKIKRYTPQLRCVFDQFVARKEGQKRENVPRSVEGRCQATSRAVRRPAYQRTACHAAMTRFGCTSAPWGVELFMWLMASRASCPAVVERNALSVKAGGTCQPRQSAATLIRIEKAPAQGEQRIVCQTRIH